jgi:hypothetical protein
MESIVKRVAADPPRRLTLREEDDASVFEVEYRLEEVAGATRLTHVSECEWKRLPKILTGPLPAGSVVTSGVSYGR